MSLRTDARGRVPFALVGVALLLGSVAFTAAVQTRAPVDAESRAGAAVREAKAAARTALEVAVARAASAAAADPLRTRANTTYGRALSADEPFRDYLRLRVYAASREALGRVDAAVGGVRASVDLPRVTDAASLRRATERVTLTPRGNGSLAVRVENASVVVRSPSGVVERVRYSPRVVVHTPVLALHRRVTRFERDLNAGVSGDFGRRLTARLHAVAWARGYAQYGGAPIANVVANRHVALQTNAALLASQRAAFGRADPGARRALGRATARGGLEDLSAGASRAASRSAEAILRRSAPGAAPTVPDAPSPRHLVVGVNGTADDAFLATTARGATGDVTEAFHRASSVEGRLVTAVTRTNATTLREPAPEGGTLLAVENESGTAVGPASAAAPPIPDGARRLASFARHVVVTRRTTRRWRVGNHTTNTTSVRRATFRVRVAVAAQPAPSPPAPERPVESLPAATTGAVVERLVDGNGGRDELAAALVAGDVARTRVLVEPNRSDDAARRARASVAALRERVRNVTVTVRARNVVQAAPAARLSSRLARRRRSLLGVPARYESLAERGRVAARARYLAAVRDGLAARASAANETRDRLDARLADAGLPRDVGSLFVRPPVSRPDGAPSLGVDAAPAYLSLSPVTPATTPAVEERYYPLAARNQNLFTTPFGDVADALTEALFGGGTTSLATGVRALDAVESTLGARPEAGLREERDALRDELARSVRAARRRARRALTADACGLDADEAREAVETAVERWPGVEARARAVANGSIASSVLAAAAGDLPDATVRDRCSVRVRVAVREARGEAGVRPAESPVSAATRASRRYARSVVHDAAERTASRVGETAWERWVGDALVGVPAGFPVSPVPGQWYATVNVWRVQVRGGYARFAVSAPAAVPSPAPNVTYVRRSSPVALDVDGDGAAERLGRNRPVEFAVQTAVVVVVPAGGSGVGDVDGQWDERSAGCG